MSASAAALAKPKGLANPAAFFAFVRTSDAVFGGRLLSDQVEGCNALTRLGAGRLTASHMAYVLATSYHETGHTMHPVKERGSDAYLARYDTGALAKALGNTPEADGDGVLFAGRGDVQLTGRRNYERATAKLRTLGVLTPAEDLVTHPDLALRRDVSAAVAVIGMSEGWFTGKRLADYLPDPRAHIEQFTEARRIINGQDRALLVAGYAVAFQRGLQLGAWC